MISPMFHSSHLRLGIALAALSAPGFAQAPGKGDPAPEFEIQSAFNGGPASYLEMKGQTVMMEIFATW